MTRTSRFAALSLMGATMLAVAASAQIEPGDRGILPVDSSGTLEIGRIHVDVGAKDSESARFAGWRMAQRAGFAKLWAKMHGQPESAAPRLSDTDLDNLVSSVVVENEQIGGGRYIADLGILFDRARAGEILGVGGDIRRSAPMLLIPLTLTAGTTTGVELRNPWQRAWAGYRTAQSPIDYVRVSGLGPDPLLVNAAQSARPARAWWRNITDYYGAANILFAEVQLHRPYPGGPAIGTFTARYGADRKAIGRFTLTAKDSGDLARMMNEGIEKMDALFAQALASGLLRYDQSLAIPAPVVVTPPAGAEVEALGSDSSPADPLAPTSGPSEAPPAPATPPPPAPSPAT